MSRDEKEVNHVMEILLATHPAITEDYDADVKAASAMLLSIPEDKRQRTAMLALKAANTMTHELTMPTYMKILGVPTTVLMLGTMYEIAKRIESTNHEGKPTFTGIAGQHQQMDECSKRLADVALEMFRKVKRAMEREIS